MITTHDLDEFQLLKNRFVNELGLLDVPQRFRLSVSKVACITFHSQPHLPLEFSVLMNGTPVPLRCQCEGTLGQAMPLPGPAFTVAVTVWGDLSVDGGSSAAPDVSPVAGKMALPATGQVTPPLPLETLPRAPWV